MRLDDALVGDAADELHMVGARDGHDVPDAGPEGDVGIAVIVNPALRTVALEALGGVFARRGRVERGHGVDKAVVRQPAPVDVDAAGGVLVIVLAHVDRAGHHQRGHTVRRDGRHGGVVVAGERIGRGLVARVGEIVDVRLDLDALVDLERFVDRQVEEGVVVVRQKVGSQHAVKRLGKCLVVVLADAELVELEVVHALERRQAQRLGGACGQVGGELREIAVGLNERRAVVRRGDGGQRVDPAALAAEEKRARLHTGGFGRGDLLRAAVGKDLEEQARRRSAEAVADEVHGALCAPAFEQRRLIVDAVALVAEVLRVLDAVVRARTDELRVQLARAIPRARERADGGGVGLIALRGQIVRQAAGGHAPVGHDAENFVALTPAEQAVHEHDRVVRAGLRICRGGRDGAQAQRQHERQQQAQKSTCFFHGFPPVS